MDKQSVKLNTMSDRANVYNGSLTIKQNLLMDKITDPIIEYMNIYRIAHIPTTPNGIGHFFIKYKIAANDKRVPHTKWPIPTPSNHCSSVIKYRFEHDSSLSDI